MAAGTKIAGGRLIRKNAKSPLLDVLIVGAGPTGSSAAFALKAAGRKVLVVDKDDIFSRARDGAGPFPTAPPDPNFVWPDGQVIALLQDLCRTGPEIGSWRVAYATLDVPRRMDLELTSIKALSDGTYKAFLANHDSGESETVTTREILLATGSGRPIPEALEHQLDNMPRYVGDMADHNGQTVCVLGSSLDAVKAVLALAKQKIDNGDHAPILWCDAGARLPRVPQEMHQDFYRAYVVHDKIRFHPRSQLLAMLTGLGEPHASICLERKAVEGVWHTNHVEVPMSRCLFAGGRESPVDWLDGLGIETTEVNAVPLVSIDDGYRTSMPGVYLAGSMLSPSHVVRGEKEERLVFREDSLFAAVADGINVAINIIGGKKKPKLKKRPEPAQAAELSGFHIAHLQPDGSRGSYHPITSKGITIGKKGTTILLPEDPMVADVHGSVHRRTGKHVLRDEDSSTGIFFKLPMDRETTINRGDLIRMGGQFLVFDADDQGARARHYDSQGNEGQLFPITDRALVLGKEGPGCLDPDDESLENRHLTLRTVAGTILARDLGTRNASYLRVMRDHRLTHEDIFMVGNHHFMFIDRQREKDIAAKEMNPKEPPGSDGPVELNVEGQGGPFPGSAGDTIASIALNAGLTFQVQCKAGACGSDPVEILEGAQYVDPEIDPAEADTLKHICGLKPGPFRLACKARVYGSVKLRFIKQDLFANP